MPSPFFQAAYCQPPKVLGVQLRPLSLAHVLLLEGIGNSFLRRHTGTRADLFSAVLVCSRTMEENGRVLFGGKLPLWRLIWWAIRWPESKIGVERDTFCQYLADYTNCPEHWESESDGKGFRAPCQYHFAMIMAREFGMTWDQAWNAPVSLARCCYDTWAETQGDKSLLSPDEQEGIQFLNSQPEDKQ